MKYQVLKGKLTNNGNGILDIWTETNFLKVAVREAEKLAEQWQEYELNKRNHLHIEVITTETQELKFMVMINHKGEIIDKYRN